MHKIKLLLLFCLFSQFTFAQWIPSNQGIPKSRFNSSNIASTPVIITNDSTLIAAAEYGLYFSHDNGNTWYVDSGSQSYYLINDLLVVGNKIIACNEDGIYLKDSNNFWVNITYDTKDLTNYRTFKLIKANEGIYACAYDGVFFSDKLGASGSWTNFKTGFKETYINTLLLTKDKMFAGTFYGVYVSSDKGLHWTETNTGLITKKRKSILVSELLNFNDLLFAGTNYGIFFSSDNGFSWKEGNNGLPGKNEIRVLFGSANTIFTALENSIYVSYNKGELWENVSDGFPPELQIYSLTILGDYIFAGTSDGVWKRLLSEMVKY